MAINPSMMGQRNRNMGPPPPIEPASEADLDAVRDTSKPIRIGKWILVLGFGSFVAWAAYAPLGEGVPT
jgi:protease secretion system membrane fusion protein